MYRNSSVLHHARSAPSTRMDESTSNHTALTAPEHNMHALHKFVTSLKSTQHVKAIKCHHPANQQDSTLSSRDKHSHLSHQRERLILLYM